MCQKPLDPINGHVNCTSNVDSLHCTLTCEEGYAFAVQPHDYFCTYDSDGSLLAPDSSIDPFPDCSCKFLLLYIYKIVTLVHKYVSDARFKMPLIFFFFAFSCALLRLWLSLLFFYIPSEI